MTSNMRSRVAYVVLMHKNPSQVGRLLRRLSTDRSSFLVPLTSTVALDVPSGGHATPRGGVPASLPASRRRCFWAGFGMVRATLGAFDHVVRQELPVDHVVLVSGQDYPLRPAEEIERFLGEDLSRSFMSAGPVLDVWPDGHWRIEMWHLVSYNNLHLTVPWERRIPGGLAPYGGEAWICLSLAAVRHVVEFARANPRFVRFFEHVLHPDEIFFQTILMNSPLRDTVVDDHLRYIDWSSDPGTGDAWSVGPRQARPVAAPVRTQVRRHGRRDDPRSARRAHRKERQLAPAG